MGSPAYRREMRARLIRRSADEVARMRARMHPDGRKRCGGCKAEKPLVAFGSIAHKRDGLHERCRECANSASRAQRKRPAVRDDGPRQCARCKRVYERAAEGFTPIGARYWSSYCRRCNGEINRAAYAQDADERREYAREYRKANPEWHNAHNRKRRALKRNVGGEHTADDVARLYEMQRGRCYWCQVAVGDDYHVDHRIPLSRGGSNGPENIVIACPPCNLRKHNKMPDEFASVVYHPRTGAA